MEVVRMPARYRKVNNESGFKHLIFVDVSQIGHSARKRWCEELFGPDDPDGKWFCVTNMFAFIDEDDAFVFRMRWC